MGDNRSNTANLKVSAFISLYTSENIVDSLNFFVTQSFKSVLPRKNPNDAPQVFAINIRGNLYDI